jgi:hypothetical protein
MEQWHSRATLAVLEGVRCLECGEIYSKPKPAPGGTVDQNPGCPLCGYVGWIPLTLPREFASLRSAADPPPRRFVPTN